MNNLLFVIAIFGMTSCVTHTNVRSLLDYEREYLAEEWLDSHYDGDDVTISCPSKKWGSPICDIKNVDGRIIFRLGCYVSPGRSLCVKENK